MDKQHTHLEAAAMGFSHWEAQHLLGFGGIRPALLEDFPAVFDLEIHLAFGIAAAPQANEFLARQHLFALHREVMRDLHGKDGGLRIEHPQRQQRGDFLAGGVSGFQHGAVFAGCQLDLAGRFAILVSGKLIFLHNLAQLPAVRIGWILDGGTLVAAAPTIPLHC